MWRRLVAGSSDYPIGVPLRAAGALRMGWFCLYQLKDVRLEIFMPFPRFTPDILLLGCNRLKC
jgi:hypothetical protein